MSDKFKPRLFRHWQKKYDIPYETINNCIVIDDGMVEGDKRIELYELGDYKIAYIEDHKIWLVPTGLEVKRQ